MVRMIQGTSSARWAPSPLRGEGMGPLAPKIQKSGDATASLLHESGEGAPTGRMRFFA
jgi:hypothetical protein